MAAPISTTLFPVFSVLLTAAVAPVQLKGRRTLRAFHFGPPPPFLNPLHFLPCPNLATPRTLGEGSAKRISFLAEN